MDLIWIDFNYSFVKNFAHETTSAQINAGQDLANTICIDEPFLWRDDVVAMSDRPAELASDGDEEVEEAGQPSFEAHAVESLRQLESPLQAVCLDQEVASASIAQNRIVVLNHSRRLGLQNQKKVSWSTERDEQSLSRN